MDTVTATETPPPGPVERVLRWLRAGYPDGVPEQDYVALLGVLQRSLTPDEIDAVVQSLTEHVADGQDLATRALVEEHIEDVVKGAPVADDVRRVSARLAAAGWPLGGPHDSDDEATSA